MAAQLLLWVAATAIVSVVFARALNRWADRQTGQRSSASKQHRLEIMRKLDLTPSPYREERSSPTMRRLQMMNSIDLTPAPARDELTPCP